MNFFVLFLSVAALSETQAGALADGADQGSVSTNLVINSGFEYETEGVPRYHYLGCKFDWRRFTGDDFEKYYLDSFKVVTDERHSGEKCLRIRLNKTMRQVNFNPAGLQLVDAGKAGVFSLWMKASVDGVTVRLRYGDGERTVRVGREWGRHEVCAPRLPEPSWFSHPISATVVDSDKYDDATLWIDDVQCEFVRSPEMKDFDKWKKSRTETLEAPDDEESGEGECRLALDEGSAKKFPGGFDPAKTYASPYRPSDLDKTRFGAGLKDNDASPRGSSPVVLRDEAALRGYVRKDGETVVLPQFSYYMNEKTAKFRVWDETGRLDEGTVDIAALPCGTNAVVVKAHGREFAGEVVKLPPADGAARINNFSRSLEHCGQPLFHIGVSSVSTQLPLSSDGTVHKIDYMRRLGFKTLHMPIWFGDKYGVPGVQAVKYCEKVGMGLLLWPGETGEEGPDAKWPRDATLKKIFSPCIFAMQVLDEPDLSVPSEKARDWIRTNKNLFPHTPIFINNTYVHVGSDYAGKEGDINMIDDYFTNQEFRNIDSFVHHVDTMRRQKPGKPAWCFLVGLNEGHCHPPSYREQIAQSWGSVCAGSTGFSWFMGLPFVSPDLRAMVDVNRELQELRDVVFSDELAGEAGVDVGIRHLRSLTRLYRGTWYVLACNIDHKPFEKVTFTLPPDAPRNGTVEVLFENRALPLKDGVFADAFEGHSRHVYRLKR